MENTTNTTETLNTPESLEMEAALTGRKLIYGVALNDCHGALDHQTGGHTLKYSKWYGALQRVYDKNETTRPTYLDCTLHNSWLRFSAFSKWYDMQPYHDVKGYNLDKDLLVPGNKEYGPDTCLIIPQSLNTMIISRPVSVGDSASVYRGVRYAPGRTKPWKAVASVGETSAKVLGYFTTEDEAGECAAAYRRKSILGVAAGMLATGEIDDRIYQAAVKYADYVIDEFRKIRDTREPGNTPARPVGYIYKSRAVMAQHLGRDIAPNEYVYHLDANRDNSDVSNLRIMTEAQAATVKANHLEDVIRSGVSVEQAIADHEKSTPKRTCKKCGSILSKEQEKYCSTECQFASMAASSKMPTAEELQALINAGQSNVKIGKKFGVSDKSVGKWRAKYGI